MDNKIRFTIPTTFKDDFLRDIDVLNKKFIDSQIVELFGSLPSSIVGSGRNLWDLPKVNLTTMEKHIKKMHQLGVKFDYLLNPTCLGNTEFTYSGRKKIRQLLNSLYNIGVNTLTISIPLLIEIAKENFPSFEVNTSVLSSIDSLEKVKFYKDIGADRITLDPDIYRNFSLLKKIRKKFPQIKLQVLANGTCLFRCPMKSYHSNVTSHFSQKLEGRSFSDFIPPFSFNERCMLIRLQNPVEFIKSCWIRPEDVKIYSDIGINYFKIAGREFPAKIILKQVSAYLQRHYDGNLADLLMGYFDAYKFKRSLKFYIDNKKLDGFLKYFLQTYPCGEGCQNCSYCKEVTEKVFEIEEGIRAEYIKTFEDNIKRKSCIEEDNQSILQNVLDKKRVSRSLFSKILDKFI